MTQPSIPGEALLVPGPADTGDGRAPGAKPAPALVAARLLERVGSGPGVTALVATGEKRADEIGRALASLADPAALEVLILPPWDCLPFDRASPSRECQGRRLAVLARLGAESERHRVLVISAEAALQRAPPSAAALARFEIFEGDTLDRDALAAFAARTGYVVDDRIDEPGEIALLGEVVDVFPASADTPVRITLSDAVVTGLRTFDPVSQRSGDALDRLVLHGASELHLPEDEAREAGVEHRLGEWQGPLATVFEAAVFERIFVEEGVASRARLFLRQVEEAHASRTTFSSPGEAAPPSLQSLYLGPDTLEDLLRSATALDCGGHGPAPRFALERRPGAALKAFIDDRRAQDRRLVISGLEHEIRLIQRMLKRLGSDDTVAVDGWAAVLASPPGALVSLEADFDRGFEASDLNVCVIAAADVLGGRVAQAGTNAQSLIGEPELRIGDVVIHEDHGLGVLSALERLVVDGDERDVIRLEYHGGATVLAPVEEFGRIWRYGSEPSAVSLDRLNADSWNRRRAEVSVQIDATAARLVELAREKAALRVEPINAPRSAYAAFVARFPFPESADQAAAIDAVIADLASGRPMNRLVCGDVGFGKTEVALRAAAAVALSGRQVMLAAPTTVLARQHLETFRKRFQGTDIAIGHLSRLVDGAAARSVKAGLESGEIRIVIGTHALASETLVFKDLALTIVDEEHRFGAKLKESLQARAAHRLVMTATPIPRTLQSALVGLQSVSVIASPPARRRPIRTFLTAFDPASVRTALLREKQRGGQSFVVAPRIEDMDEIATILARLTPELEVVAAHGQMAAAAVDDAMVGFAEGRGDVLLATNIIETGLDVPRANTMVIWRPDRFGLAQLHQLRGRVGRSRAQGFTYLLTDPDTELAEATRSRLGALEAFDRLGAGFAISVRDLDLRGGGDLLGDEQAGHMRLIGAALYQTILERAVRAARGEEVADALAPLRIDASASLPQTYIPDATIRINLYARLARVTSAAEVDGLEDEIADRFGPPPPEAAALLSATRVAALAAEAGVVRIVTGPKATAFTVREARLAEATARAPANAIRRWVENRLVCDAPDDGEHDQAFIAAILSDLAA